MNKTARMLLASYIEKVNYSLRLVTFLNLASLTTGMWFGKSYETELGK